MLEMAEGRRDDPKRIGTAEHFLVRLESRHGHPVKREKQHKHENAQRNIDSDPPARDGLQIIHALLLKILLIIFFHLSSPRCQALRCSPKYENMMAASRKGIIMMASAAQIGRASCRESVCQSV